MVSQICFLMKNILCLFFLLLSVAGFSQVTNTLNGRYNITSASGSGPNFTLAGSFNDDLSAWDGSQVVVGDIVFVLEGPSVYALEITAISSQTFNTVNCTVNDASATLGSVSLGPAAIIRPTTNQDYPTIPPNLRTDLASGIQNYFASLVDADVAGGGGGGGGVTSFNTRTGPVVPTANDYSATQVSSSATGDVTATNVQSAIAQLAAQKVAESDLSYRTLNETRHAKDYFQAGDEPSDYIERAILACPENTVLHIPEGQFNMQRSLRITRAVHIVGGGTTGTILNFPKDSSGIVLSGGSLNNYVRLTGVRIQQGHRNLSGVEGTYNPAFAGASTKGVGLNIASRSIVRDVYVTGFAGHGWMVNSKIEGVAYETIETGFTDTLRDVYFNSGALGWFCGDNGAFSRVNFTSGTSTTVLTPSSLFTTDDLHGVHASGSANLIVVGENAGIYQTSDASSTMTFVQHITRPNTTALLRDIYLPTSTRGFIVGDGGTVWKSTTIGSTNVWVDTRNSAPSVNYKAVWAFDQDNVFIVGSSGAFLRTTDGGATWTQVLTIPSTTTLMDIYFRSTGGWAVAANGDIYYSANTGSTWTLVSTGATGLQTVAAGNRNRPYTFGTNVVLKSSTAGTTWSSDDGFPGSGVMYGANFTSTTSGWVVGEAGQMYRAYARDPNINNWIIESGWAVGNGRCGLYVAGADVNAGACFFFDARNNGSFGVLDASFLGNYYGMIHTNNNGGRSVVTHPAGGLRYYAMVDIDGSTVLDSLGVGAGAFEPGVTAGWENVWAVMPGSKGGTAVIVGDDGVFSRTEDAGATWDYSTIPGLGDIEGVGLWGNSRIFACGAGGNVYRSTNEGNTWTTQTLSGATFYDVDMVNVNTGWLVGGGGEIWKTIDGGTNWVSQTSGTANTLLDNYMLCNSAGAGRGYAVGANGTLLRATLTANAPDTWTPVVTGTTETLRSIWVVQPFTTTATNCTFTKGLIAGSGGTIGQSADGTSWAFSVPVSASHDYYDIHSANGTYILAVGADGAVIRSTNSGSTFAAVTLSAPYNTYDLTSVFSLGDKDWFIVGENNTVLKSTDYGATFSTLTSGAPGAALWKAFELNTGNLNGKNPGWSASTQYFAGGAIAAIGATNTSSFSTVYAENNQPPSAIDGLVNVLGGLTGAFGHNRSGQPLLHETNGLFTMPKGLKVSPGIDNTTDSQIKIEPDNFSVQKGSSTLNGVNIGFDDGSIKFNSGTTTAFQVTTGLNTTVTGNTGAALPLGRLVIPRPFYFGSSSSNLREFSNASSAPAWSGQGNIAWNRSPSSGSPLGWVHGPASTVFEMPLLGYPYYHEFRNAGTLLTRRASVDLLTTSTVALTGADNAGTSRTELSANVVAGSIGTSQIADGSVANADLANMAANTLKGRGAGTGAPQDLSFGAGFSVDGSTLNYTSTMNEAVETMPLVAGDYQFSSGTTNLRAVVAYRVPKRFNNWYLKDVSWYNVVPGSGTGGSDNVAKMQVVYSGLDSLARIARGWLGNVGYFTATNVGLQVKEGMLLRFYMDTIQTGGTAPKGFGVSLNLVQAVVTPTDENNLVHTSEYGAVIAYARANSIARPTAAQQVQQNTYVKHLIDNGLWATADVVRLCTRGSKAFAMLNLKSPGTNTLGEVGTITWADGQGLHGGASNTANGLTDYNPTAFGGQYTQNSATLALWMTDDVDNNRIAGSANSTVRLVGVSGTGYRINYDTGTPNTHDFSGPGMIAMARTSSTDVAAYKNTTATTSTIASTANSTTISLVKDPASANGTSSKMGAVWIGAGLNSTQITALYNGLNAVMQ